MRFYQALLLVVCVLLSSSATLAAGPEPGSGKTLKVDHSLVRQDSRLLRVDNVAGVGTEDRIQSWFRWLRVNYWIKAGKSESDVKKALKLEGMPEDVLKASPEYLYYQKLMLKTGRGAPVLDRGKSAVSKLKTSVASDDEISQKLDEWMATGSQGLYTWNAWLKLGLKNIKNAAERQNSDAYKIYMRYAEMYDNRLYQRFKNGDDYQVVVGPYSEETTALVHMWAQAQRPDLYVIRMLGLAGKVTRRFSQTSTINSFCGGKDTESFYRYHVLEVSWYVEQGQVNKRHL
ncbi:hypothetical protein PF011_g14380 [Phytophthora fragariae]|uniref:RxLR effector protein n=1 Tax=Phytophthora fragariae TaxID=53985 RepID=A0A6A3JXJ2_9STRA|nr:hypothetical protein PF011_g14380 [Phytophthora fragariae]